MRKIVQSHDVPHHRDDFDRFFFLFQINVYPTCFITSCSSYILRFVRFSFCYVYFYKLFNTTKERTFFASLENILNVKYPCETINYPDEDFVSRRIEKNLSPIQHYLETEIKKRKKIKREKRKVLSFTVHSIYTIRHQIIKYSRLFDARRTTCNHFQTGNASSDGLQATEIFDRYTPNHHHMRVHVRRAAFVSLYNPWY